MTEVEPGVEIDEEVFEPGESHGTVIRLSLTAALGGFLFGYDSSVINGAVAAITAPFSASAAVLGFPGSSALLGGGAGGSGGAFVLMGGAAVGIASVIAPTYIAEIAPARIRGRLGSLQQLAIVTGIFLALLVDYALATAAGGAQSNLALGLPAWRWMFLAMVVPALLSGGLAFTIPESPRYLIAKRRLDEAGSVLRRVLGNIDLDAKVEQIKQTLKREGRPSMRDLRGPRFGLLPIVWVGSGLSVFQQFVGINVIFYYRSEEH